MRTPRAREATAQASIAAPVAVSSLCNRARDVASLAFVGATKDVGALAGAALASTFANVTGNAVVVGLSSATVTLCGQAYGAGAHGGVGGTAQRGAVAILMACALAGGAAWPRAAACARAMGQDGEVAEKARAYIGGLIPGLFAYGLNATVQGYLQAIGTTRPQAYAGVLATLAHPLWCVIFSKLGFGFVGPAYATSVSTSIVLALNVAYIAARRRVGWFRERDEQTALRRDACWSGFSAKEMFDVDGLVKFFRLGIPGVLLMAEWWASEFLIVMAGLLPDPKVAVSAMSIYQVTNAFAFMIAVGFGVSTATRVSHEVGAGNAPGARLAASVAMWLIFVVEFAVALVVVAARDRWPSVFTSDGDVKALVSKLMIPLSFYVFFDGVCCVSTSVLRGAARQAQAAPIVLVCYYLIGLPLSAYFAFAKSSPFASHRAVGLAVGGVVGTASHAGVMTLVALRLDWQKELDRATALRAGKSADATEVAYRPLVDEEIESSDDDIAHDLADSTQEL
ncbi:Multi antimicrobial extrusion protein [Ostreococcus tauri]|uniref:Protein DETOXIFICATION n=1 Tax=Ostreococcus tauri TaxID=70448 RepID=Q01H24_OSTTA|nr:Multi antimicrobial extrusion protein [Ostreococcus tauri]CAL49970.1 Multi antimicrobial extrusion protein [Ostreococcus tauri]|eukprot:XP_003074118.1 Multi antimicrobial extrusion protein [Ostreococcus tauri]